MPRGAYPSRSQDAGATGGAGGLLPAGTETGQLLRWDNGTALWSASTTIKVLDPVANVVRIVNDGAATSGIELTTLAASGGAGGTLTLDSATTISIGTANTGTVGLQATSANIATDSTAWFTKGVGLVRTDTFTATTSSYVWAAGQTAGVSFSFAQSAAAGGNWTLTGQQGANGSAGGSISITAGAAGTTGTRAAGGTLALFAGGAGGNSGAAVNGSDVTAQGSSGSGGGSVNGTVRLRTSAGTNVIQVGDVAGAGAIGFYNVAPVVRSAAYTVTNPTTDRALNVTADTLAQGLQVLGTLILDLQLTGIIG